MKIHYIVPAVSLPAIVITSASLSLVAALALCMACVSQRRLAPVYSDRRSTMLLLVFHEGCLRAERAGRR